MKKKAKKSSKGKPKSKLKKLHVGKDFSKPVRKTPKQPRLPGMEDAAIQEIEDKAREFVSFRDERAEAGKNMSTAEKELVDLMRAHGKEQYFHAGILIKVKPTSERANVRLNATKDPDAEPEAEPADEQPQQE
jgi:hypothetical protein